MSKDLEMFTVRVDDTIRTAMLKITANKHRAVVVVDRTKVVGMISDGDIRRALLKDVLPIAPVQSIMNLNCVTTTKREPAALAEEIRRAKVTVLPVVSDENDLIDVALAYEPSFEDPQGPRGA